MQFRTARFAGFANTTTYIIAYNARISKNKITIMQKIFLNKSSVPESAQCLRQVGNVVNAPDALPVRRVKCRIRRCGISVVGENDHSAVGRSAYYTPSRLKNTVHAGVGIGVVVAVLDLVLLIIPDKIALK